MKICILQSSYEDSNSPFSKYDPYCDPSHYYQGILSVFYSPPISYFHSHVFDWLVNLVLMAGLQHEHNFERVLVKKSTAAQQIRELSTKGFDVFINLCDGAFDEDRAGLEVVQFLEK